MLRAIDRALRRAFLLNCSTFCGDLAPIVMRIQIDAASTTIEMIPSICLFPLVGGLKRHTAWSASAYEAMYLRAAIKIRTMFNVAINTINASPKPKTVMKILFVMGVPWVCGCGCGCVGLSAITTQCYVSANPN